MEEIFETVTGGALWGLGFGLVSTLFGDMRHGLRPVAKNVIKSGMAMQDWLRTATAETRETVQDIYEEAKAERV